MDKIENGVLTLGVDVGSTTVKSVLRDGEKIIFRSYDQAFFKGQGKDSSAHEKN